MPDSGYSQFLLKHGLTEDQMQRLMRDLPEPQPHADVSAGFRRAASPIHGTGMFAVRQMSRGETFPVCCGHERYDLARFVNHSDKPNARLEFDQAGQGIMSLLRDLIAGEEVLMDYADNFKKSTAASAAYFAKTILQNQ